jgi:hypothetical protein
MHGYFANLDKSVIGRLGMRVLSNSGLMLNELAVNGQ